MNSDLESQEPMDIASLRQPLACFTLFYAVSFIGYLGAAQGMWFWYIGQRRPAWALPTWAFTCIWTILYGVLASATWQIWKTDSSRSRNVGLWLVGLQLFMSALWPWQFFAWHQPIASWVECAALSFVCLLATIAYWKAKPQAGALMLPQLAWLLYLTLLDVAVWVLNR